MDRLRLYAASVALAVPAAVFALNALVSYRERGFVELFDLPAAIAFAILSVLVGRGTRPALYGAIALVAVYLVTAFAGGVIAFVSYWVATLVLALQALPVSRRARARRAV
jgi:CHASE2 domain-containing sensor protein